MFYHRLADEFDWHVDLVHDLTLELTRAGNLVCDVYRLEVDPTFRAQSGVLMVVRGPMEGFDYDHLRPEYRNDERTGLSYQGLDEFVLERRGRDIVIGNGESTDSTPRARARA